ncbi:hypothetical protein MUK42_16131 [Musa troglodytarum]|uniref:Uncharacterized protein n=1 Tax=Musa troglodytarum TaxID=320322 RepID=A0A9E7KT46_9LILI|nr:hypothetical protein MUK42_16131 [Musa troglodytarum]
MINDPYRNMLARYVTTVHGERALYTSNIDQLGVRREEKLSGRNEEPETEVVLKHLKFIKMCLVISEISFSLKKFKPSSMMEGGIVIEAITNSSIELLLPSRESYARSLFHADDELRSF